VNFCENYILPRYNGIEQTFPFQERNRRAREDQTKARQQHSRENTKSCSSMSGIDMEGTLCELQCFGQSIPYGLWSAAHMVPSLLGLLYSYLQLSSAGVPHSWHLQYLEVSMAA
jgi:hypothetical protein